VELAFCRRDDLDITDWGVFLNHGNLHDLMGPLNNLNVDRMDFHYATPVCCVMHAAGDVMQLCELTAD
jgi:hypothetical protein